MPTDAATEEMIDLAKRERANLARQIEQSREIIKHSKELLAQFDQMLAQLSQE